MPTPPTAVTTASLTEGSGATRSFGAVTTQAGDYVVVGIQVEAGASGESFTPSGTGVTFPGSATADSGTPGNSNGRALIWVGTDSAGGSRTITITASGGVASSKNYAARLTVVRGSTGPSGSGANSAAQTVSVTRTGDNSMMFYGVTDWSAGAVGTPTWTPGGSTTQSQQGSAATYIFGRWDDSGSAGTANHGISTPSYTTPAVAAVEMLSTAGGGVTLPLTPQALPGPAWQRQFQHRQQIPLAVPPAGGATVNADASLTATATITPTTAVTANATASPSVTATITPAAVVTASGTVSQTVTASISADATVTPAGAAATLTITATISPAAAVTANATASPSTTATITVAGATQANASASLTATATITATATVTRAASASPAVTATITPSGAVTANAQASLTATASISADATVGAAPILAQASLTATATITAAATRIPNAAATPTTTATITATGTVIRPASAAPTTTATITAAAATQANASAASTITAAITVTADVVGPFTVGVLTSSSSASTLTATTAHAASLTASSARGGPT